MPEFNSAQPVGEIVAHFPGASRLFERHGIDYCCGGRSPLEKVCAERGLDAQAILSEIGAAQQSAPADDRRDWTQALLGDLVEHLLVAYHAPLREELPRLSQLAGRAAAAHPEGDLLPFGEIFSHLGELRAELESHMRKEEVVLFPAVARLEQAVADPQIRSMAAEPCGSIAYPIRAMEHEHLEASAQLAALRGLTGGFAVPEGACATVAALVEGLATLETDLHRHIHLENEILFPRALALASEGAEPRTG